MILVTGAAGFIGFHLTKRLLDMGHEVCGLDNLNEYYDVTLKKARLMELGIADIDPDGRTHSKKYKDFTFLKLDLRDVDRLERHGIENTSVVINLAAQAGVRYSLDHSSEYIDSNIVGFHRLIEYFKSRKVEHFMYASSSSVYGLNREIPFDIKSGVDHPMSIYAATKRANELVAHSYSHLYDIPTTGLRFFTVYGPWGRPDMAYYMFTKSIDEGKQIDVYNDGNMERDFTYVDDVVTGIVNVMEIPPRRQPIETLSKLHPGNSSAPYRVLNIGRGKPEKLMDFISVIEGLLGKKADTRFLPLQPGDVLRTWADVTDLRRIANYEPTTAIAEGLKEFVSWYTRYHA